ncbi:unnamed protein product [Rhizophagus irregularis]|nr:unnamed protein product [Rhizophagus irregularis]CAB5384803.1 unnamed protein product [Rhizophagus irregularis]
MNYFPIYDGNIHPDEWMNNIQKYYSLWPNKTGLAFMEVVKLLVDSAIKLPAEIYDLEKLRDVLKKDITFTVFKDLNKRKLQSLKYISERDGGNTLRFFTEFRKLCYNSETNDIGEQKKYFSKTLDDYPYFLTEFGERVNNINSMDELIKEFEEIVMNESNIIGYGSTVALKHVATGKYLTSIGNLCYTTGSQQQLIYASDSEFNPNVLWKMIKNQSLDNNYSCTKTDIRLQHKISGQLLGICYYYNYDHYYYHKSPSSNHTEVSCDGNNYYDYIWNFKHSKLENYEGYIKSNDIVNLSINRTQDNRVEFLRSHDVQFTIGNETFQEVVCHNERLGGIDEWCIELIRQA